MKACSDLLVKQCLNACCSVIEMPWPSLLRNMELLVLDIFLCSALQACPSNILSGQPVSQRRARNSYTLQSIIIGCDVLFHNVAMAGHVFLAG